MTGLLSHLLALHGVVAYALVGTVAFAEAALFVGFVLPGETAVLLGGVLASQHAVALPEMAGVAVLAAIAGDSVGYEVGARYGERVLELRPLRRRRERIDRARRYLRDNGGRAVFVGRFTAFLRAVMPGLAGISHLPYRRFLLFNATGGLLWGTGFTLLGYLAGASYTRVEKTVGRASLGLLVLIALAGFGAWLRARRRSAAKPSATAAPDRHRERRPPVISPSSAASPTSAGVSQPRTGGGAAAERGRE